MLVAICSDTHDNEVNIKKFLNYCTDHQVGVIFHCGDWTKPEMMRLYREHFTGDIHGVIGNAQIKPTEMTREAITYNIKLEKTYQTVTIDGITMGLAHRPQEAKKLAEKGAHAIIFYGHTHQPWQEKYKECFMVNPGTLAGMFTPPTFALYDTKSRRLELKLLDNL